MCVHVLCCVGVFDILWIKFVLTKKKRRKLKKDPSQHDCSSLLISNTDFEKVFSPSSL